MVVLHIIEKPPYKQSYADSCERKNVAKYKNALIENAKKTFKSPLPRTVKIKLAIKYRRSQGKADSLNIIGGIGDALQKIAYFNDRQIVEVHYIEEIGERDEYWVEIRTLQT